MNNKRSLVSLAVLAALSSNYGHAQDSFEGFTLEELVVTAQRREQNLQQTPVAVTAFGQQALDDIGATNLQDLIESVPTIHTSRTNNGAVQITLRGITSTNNTELGDPAVSFNVDGVYMARPQAASALMFDMEGIEVLRGPQGTLFGRNSPAGAINLRTAKPSQEKEGSIAVAAGNYDRTLIQGAVNVPVSETFALRFAGMHDQRESFNEPSADTPVPVSGDELYDTRDDLALRASGLWTPTDEFSWHLTFDYLDSAGLPQANVPTGIEDVRVITVNRGSTFEMDTTSLRSKMDWNFSESVGLSYLASFNTLDTTRFSAGQNGGGDQFADRENESFTQELQIKSLDGDKFEWIAGLFYYEESNTTDFQVKTAPRAGLRFLQPDRTSESFAVFGQGTYNFADQWAFTLGFRQSEDKKEDRGGENQDCGQPGPPFPITDETFLNEDVGTSEADRLCSLTRFDPEKQPNSRAREWSAPTWRVQVDYDQTDDIFWYGSIATGYKAGGFGDAGSPDYDEENLTNYELGLKADLADGKLRLNSALYYSDYQDFQVTAIEGSGNAEGAAFAATRNAGEASIAGLEVEFIWLPTANTRLSGFVAYTDATFDDFDTHVDTAFTDPNLPLPGPGGGDAWAIDATGNQLPFVSELSAQLVYEYNFEFGDGATLRPRLSWSWRDDYFMRAANISSGSQINQALPESTLNSQLDLQDAHSIVDASLRYTSANESWSVEVFGRNLTDEEVAISGNSAGAGSNNRLEYSFKPPRTYGIRFDYRWGN